MTALVVDNSKTMRSVLRRILCMRGFNVAEADMGQQAIDVLRRIGVADLVLVDWAPQEVAGLEFASHVRLESVHDTTVIMLVTGQPSARDLHRAVIAGAYDCLSKPFTSLQLDEKLVRAGLHFAIESSHFEANEYDSTSVSLVEADHLSRTAFSHNPRPRPS